jgi:ASC-1-like (ASCH) protein
MTHGMKLNLIAFEQMKAGNRAAEIRLYDEKRKLINVGGWGCF